MRKPWMVHRLHWIKGVNDVLKLLPPVFLAGLSALAWIWATVPWWVVPLTALIVFYLSLTAGMAWEQSYSSSVRIGPLEIYGEYSTFYTLIENNSSVPSLVRAQLTEMVDSSGRRLLRGSSDLVLSIPSNETEVELLPGAKAEAWLLRVNTVEEPHPILTYWTTIRFSDGTSSTRFFPCDGKMPPGKHGRVSLTISVTCKGKDGSQGLSASRTFAIIPDLNSPTHYVVEQESPPKKGAGDAPNGLINKLFTRLCELVERAFSGRK